MQTMKFTSIKGLTPRLAEVGKIKIGGKGNARTSKSGGIYQLPVKFDHFVVTGLQKDASGNFVKDSALMQSLGQSPKELDIIFLHDDPTKNLVSQFALYKGKSLYCHGNGEQAERQADNGEWLERECPCDYLDKSDSMANGKLKCKPSGVLSCMLVKSPTVGGVYKFRTTSWNSIINLQSSMAFISSITGGILAGLPLRLTLSPKTVMVQDKIMTIYTVNLVYPGEIPALLESAHKIGQRRAMGLQEGRAVRLQLEQLLTSEPEGETETDIGAEFYPENDEHAQLEDTVIEMTPSVILPSATPEPQYLGDPGPLVEEQAIDDGTAIKKITAAQRAKIFTVGAELWPHLSGDPLKTQLKIYLSVFLGVKGGSLSDTSENALSHEQASGFIKYLEDVLVEFNQKKNEPGRGGPETGESGEGPSDPVPAVEEPSPDDATTDEDADLDAAIEAERQKNIALIDAALKDSCFRRGQVMGMIIQAQSRRKCSKWKDLPADEISVLVLQIEEARNEPKEDMFP